MPFSFPHRERKPRPQPETPPDIAPGQFAEECAQQLNGLGGRCVGCAVLSALLLLLTLPEAGLLPAFLADLLPDDILLPVSIGLFVLCVLLSYDVLRRGLVQLTNKAPDGDTLALFAAVFTLADCVTLYAPGLRTVTLPFCAPCALVLAFHLIGRWCSLSAQREACRTATAVPQPYLVTQDPALIAGQTGFRKWTGTTKGLGSQLRTMDRPAFAFQRLTPVLLVACCVLPLITTVAHHQPRLVFWSYSALFCAAATLGCALSFGLPLRLLGKKLSALGVALAGWPGLEAGRGCRSVLLGDYDLYPPGSVGLASSITLGKLPMPQVIVYTASVLRASGSGLTFLFDRLLRNERGSYLPVESLTMQDLGLIAQAQGQRLLVGNSDFMSRMGIALPPGVKVKDAIFCAVGTEAVGMFVLKYTTHPTLLPIVRALFAHRLRPALITRDFNITPHRLRVRAHLPVDQMLFPDLQRRVTLSSPRQTHSGPIVAVLTREGLAPYATAVIAAKRVRRAARWNGLFANVSACVGVFLTACLSSAGALSAMCAWNLSLFLLLWLAPTVLLSLWVTQY